MEELDVNNYLIRENLFDLFKVQLKKDFDSCSLNTDFIDHLPSQFELLKDFLLIELEPLLKSNSLLSNLLYRIDINEIQIKNYQLKNSTINFEEVLAELIIKRILQKVILKKKFSQ
jgi:hypothetical protein